jgi:hypothetical protein
MRQWWDGPVRKESKAEIPEEMKACIISLIPCVQDLHASFFIDSR